MWSAPRDGSSTTGMLRGAEPYMAEKGQPPNWLHEPGDFFQRQGRQGGACGYLHVFSVGLKLEGAEALAIIVPDLRDAQRRVDVEHPRVAVRDLDLDGEVGGRIDVQVERLFAPPPQARLVGQVDRPPRGPGSFGPRPCS